MSVARGFQLAMSADTSGFIDKTLRQTQTVPDLKLKGGLFPLTSLELVDYNETWLREQLQKKTNEAPEFFKQAPVILNTEQFSGDACDVDLKKIKALCAEYGLMLVALRSNEAGLQQQAIDLGMGLLSANRKRGGNGGGDGAQHPVKGRRSTDTFKNTIIKSPVRSGQQVYASGGDLIVMAPVSAGAEILADGNIHVYGPIRGRALAGVNGDINAGVFCQSLEAELISIAGRYTTLEDSESHYWKQPVHIFLQDDEFCIEPLPVPSR